MQGLRLFGEEQLAVPDGSGGSEPAVLAFTKASHFVLVQLSASALLLEIPCLPQCPVAFGFRPCSCVPLRVGALRWVQSFLSRVAENTPGGRWAESTAFQLAATATQVVGLQLKSKGWQAMERPGAQPL